MVDALENPGDDEFKIPPVEDDGEIDQSLNIEINRLISSNEGISISLKYYQDKVECFSEWQGKDLKRFSGLISKIRNMTAAQLTGSSSLCDTHKGKPKAQRYSWPDGISEEITRYELKVDQSKKSRVHGALIGSTFFLVWLDRNHQVFPS